MKSVALILLAAGALPLAAQDTKHKADRLDPVTAFAIQPPDETSPFFMVPQNAAVSRRVDYAGPDAGAASDYPKNRNSPDSAAAQIKEFFGGIFSSVNLGPIRTAPFVQKLVVEPEKFPLADRHELTATYTIRNNTSKISRLDYPTSQRIEILTHDPKGAVIDRWSDDRSFQTEDGVVIINPKERIEYQEKIPTRDMKAGEQYRVEALTTSAEKFQAEKFVTPQ